MCQFSNPEVVAVASTVIALLAMFATFWQARIAREHNKLSVRPFMEHAQERLHGGHISISVGNHGLGPAVINSVLFTHKSVDKPMEIVDFLDWIVGHIQLKDVNYLATNITEGTVFSVDKVVTVYDFKLLESQEYEFQFIAEILDNSIIHITYKSFYDRDYTCKAPLTVA